MALSGLTGSLVGGWLALAVLALVLGMLYALTAREAACVRQAIAQQAEARAATRVTGAKKLDLPRSADYWWAFAGRFGIILGLGLWQGYQFYILSDYIKLGQDRSRLALFRANVKDAQETRRERTFMLVIREDTS